MVFMKVIKVKDKQVGKRLLDRLIKKGYVVAEVKREQLNHPFVKRADVVIVYPEETKEVEP